MAGTYTGEVRGGVVVFEAGHQPPEGARVRVETIEPPEVPVARPDADPIAGTKALLLRWAARAEAVAPEMPSDLAENHDHYAHGKPRE
jgi:hypothetical protein